jgi:phage FluMu protein Com
MMQIRCFNCHKPYAMGKEDVYAALDEITEQNLVHFNVPCPHCRRVNRVSRDDLLRSAPEWTKKQKEEVDE